MSTGRRQLRSSKLGDGRSTIRIINSPPCRARLSVRLLRAAHHGSLRFLLRAGRRSARRPASLLPPPPPACRSEEHTSELQSLMRISYAVFCLKKKHKHSTNYPTTQ